MYVEMLAKGLAAGLLIAAPVGPVGVLCVHRTLVWGRIHGLLSGLGAAVADALFAVVVAFGLGFVADFVLSEQYWLRLGGGTLLLLLGARTLLIGPPAADEVEPKPSLRGDCASTFVLTATNPLTLLSFLGVFAALGVAGAQTLGQAHALVLGVFAGSAAWWVLLSLGVALMRRAVEAIYLRWVHVVSGALLIIFGSGVLASLAF